MTAVRTICGIGLAVILAGGAYLLWPRWTGATLPDIGPGAKPVGATVVRDGGSTR